MAVDLRAACQRVLVEDRGRVSRGTLASIGVDRAFGGRGVQRPADKRMATDSLTSRGIPTDK